MRANHSSWTPAKANNVQPLKKPYEAMLLSGKAVEVNSTARKAFPGTRIAIETKTYERYVAWPCSAMRRHLICLDETARMEAILRAAGGVFRHDTPAEFVLRAVACDAISSDAIRHSFVLERFVEEGNAAWLIRQ